MTIDSRVLAFAGGAALFIVTPGASTALVTRNAIGGGPVAAFFTTTGIMAGSSIYAIGSALGLSFVLAHSPSALQTIRLAGAAYLTLLGLESLWRALGARGDNPSTDTRPRRGGAVAATGGARFTEGLVTNILNPSILMFYVSYVPQFVRPGEPYFVTFMMLASIHITMAFMWLAFYGTSVGSLGEVLGRPRVKRTIEALTGMALIYLAWRLGFAAR